LKFMRDPPFETILCSLSQNVTGGPHYRPLKL
jgi:hypothetical protein